MKIKYPFEDRYGDPSNRLVALPVKDPYHITRNLFLILDLLL
ncbi:hypothetical protein ACFWDG_09070 [Peribacillus sp. NPDC060186]